MIKEYLAVQGKHLEKEKRRDMFFLMLKNSVLF